MPSQNNSLDGVVKRIYVNDTAKAIKKNKTNEYANYPLQQITYGAPGTGKSFEINEITKGHSVIRTTFHPDSDYSTFVGSYKPVMQDCEVKVVPVVLDNGASFEQNAGTYKEKRITYKFVKQAFLKAYLMAWKKYVENEDVLDPQFLIIEEINRGNCAQIFGDLFQLLDRANNNFSSYPIEADSDLQQEIENAFKNEPEYYLTKNIDIEGEIEDYTSIYGSTLSKDVQAGRILLLPPNLYIWATMNTSDQSLFPIDSAFKRRWEWKYIKISNGYKRNSDGGFQFDADGKRIPLGWEISANGHSYDWYTFICEINKKIGDLTSSDDKKLGYFFCKPQKDSNKIYEEAFVGKVMFYLWNDVFKDNDKSLFKVTKDKSEPCFDDFFEEEDTGKIISNKENVEKFILNVLGKKNYEDSILQPNVDVSSTEGIQ